MKEAWSITLNVKNIVTVNAVPIIVGAFDDLIFYIKE